MYIYEQPMPIYHQSGDDAKRV